MANGLLYIGGAAIIIVLLILFALDRWNVFGGDSSGESSGTERIEREAAKEGDFSVPILKRHKTLTLPGKVVVTSVACIVFGGLLYIYLTLRGGAPAKLPYANAMKMTAIVVGALAGGIAWANTKNAKRGRIDILHEDEDTVIETETVYFDPSEANTDAEGNTIVYEHFKTRFLGMFGKRKLVAHDRELRTRRGALLSDRIAHEIPAHAQKFAPNHYVVRTKGRRVKDGVNTAADYAYRSPNVLPYSSYIRQDERVSKMETRLDSALARLARSEQEVEKLRRAIETEEYEDKQELIDQIQMISSFMGQQNRQYNYRQDQRPERHPDSQRDVDEMSEEPVGSPP